MPGFEPEPPTGTTTMPESSALEGALLEVVGDFVLCGGVSGATCAMCGAGTMDVSVDGDGAGGWCWADADDGDGDGAVAEDSFGCCEVVGRANSGPPSAVAEVLADVALL